MNYKQRLLLNKQLPKSDQTVISNSKSLYSTNELGFQIKIDDKLIAEKFNISSNSHLEVSNLLLINDKKICYGYDTTLHHEEFPKDAILIGDGFIGQAKTNHISTPWNKGIWVTEIPAKTTMLKNRKGWVCSMHRNDEHRDLICFEILKNYMKWFEYENFFCYDFGGQRFKHLEPYMIRPMFKQTWEEMTDHSKRTSKMVKHNSGIKSDYLIQALMAPWHFSALLEIVPETSCDIFFITEKTVKPIAAGMPFVIISCVKFLYHLRKLGFKTFHPYIDESYDLEKDKKIRTNMALKSADKFLSDPKNLQEIQNICLHNQKILKKIQNHSYHHQIWKKLRRFITFG